MRLRLISFTLFLCGHITANANEISVLDPWVRAAPASIKTRAAYMTIHNHSTTPVVLTGATSAQFKTIELHRSFIADGMMKMSKEERTVIKPNTMLKLEPNSYHFMMFGMTKTVTGAENIEIELQFEQIAPVKVQAEVRKEAPTP